MNLHTKVKLTLLLSNVLTLIAFSFFFSWWGLGLAILVWICFNFGVSAGFHRLFAHRSYETNFFWRWSLLISGTLAGIGSSISWIGQHRMHHANSDVEGKDPYYPHNNWIKAWIFGPWALPISPMSVKDLIRDRDHRWLHDHYFKILAAYVVILFLINPVLVCWAWAVPSAATFFSLQVTGVLGHMIGTAEYALKDRSKNSHILNIFTFGESYQNSHHHDVRRIVLGKYDLVGYTIKHIFAK